MNEISVLVRSKSGKQELVARALLISAGAKPEELVRSEYASFVRVSFFTPKTLKAQSMIKILARKKVPGLTLRTRLLSDSDWLTKWNRFYTISSFGKTFSVVPLKDKAKYHGKKIPIYIDPKGSFGSGTHATTKLVVQLMEKLKGRFDSMLDVGTGTGILLIAGQKLGAKNLTGLDNEAHSVKTTRFNLRQNQIQNADLICADLNSFKTRRTYDLVTANLISKVLVENQSCLARLVKKGGHLIVSGIEKMNFREFLDTFSPGNTKLLKTTNLRNWCCAFYKKLSNN